MEVIINNKYQYTILMPRGAVSMNYFYETIAQKFLVDKSRVHIPGRGRDCMTYPPEWRDITIRAYII